MSTVVTGASGHLGRLVVDQLLADGTPPAQIVATGRDIDKLTGLAQDGVTVRRADFADPVTLDDAFAGADAMLLISTTTVGERFDNARKAIDAAVRAGASQIVYTSIINASTAQMTLADQHRRTELTAALTGAGLPPEMAASVADADAGLARGELFTDSDDLVKLIGRPATTAYEAVQNAAIIEESR